MNLASVVDRIESQSPAFKLVGGAAKFDQAKKLLPASPAAFVILGQETGAPNPFMDQLVEQNLTVKFVVVIATRNLEDDRGLAAADSLGSLRKALFAALLNWTPDEAEQGCEYDSGQIMELDNGVLWWADTFNTAYMIRSP